MVNTTDVRIVCGRGSGYLTHHISDNKQTKNIKEILTQI